MAINYKLLAMDLRSVAERVHEASYATIAKDMLRTADNIEEVFCKKHCPACGQEIESANEP